MSRCIEQISDWMGLSCPQLNKNKAEITDFGAKEV